MNNNSNSNKRYHRAYDVVTTPQNKYHQPVMLDVLQCVKNTLASGGPKATAACVLCKLYSRHEAEIKETMDKYFERHNSRSQEQVPFS